MMTWLGVGIGIGDRHMIGRGRMRMRTTTNMNHERDATKLTFLLPTHLAADTRWGSILRQCRMLRCGQAFPSGQPLDHADLNLVNALLGHPPSAHPTALHTRSGVLEALRGQLVAPGPDRLQLANQALLPTVLRRAVHLLVPLAGDGPGHGKPSRLRGGWRCLCGRRRRRG